MSRGIKNIPTAAKVSSLDNQKSFMIMNVLLEEIKNLDAWENSSAFRQVCFDKYGPDYSPIKNVEEEIKKVLEYANTSPSE